MGLFDINKLKSTLQDTVDKAATAVKDGTLTEAVDGVTSAVKDKVDKAATAVKDGTLTEAVTTAVNEAKVSERVSDIIKTATGETSSTPQASEATTGLTAQDAISVFYYLMAADGELHNDELEKLDSICSEMGVDQTDRQSLTDECQAKLEASASSVSPLIPALTCVDKVLYSPSYIAEDETIVSPKLLLWDLLAIAYSDGSCDDSERELIKHVASVVGINEPTLLEMESYILTLLDIEQEQTWVKTTDQTYLAIEKTVNELEVRKAAVFDGAKALITL